jgi:hypothetical protein
MALQISQQQLMGLAVVTVHPFVNKRRISNEN